jgi:hypothetical protein
MVVAVAALVAALALSALPEPAGSTSRMAGPAPGQAALAVVSGPTPVGGSSAVPDVGLRSAGAVEPGYPVVEPGDRPAGPAGRTPVDQPASNAGYAWKPGRYQLTGYATFYDNGTTAMRLPRGTIVRICGTAGCIERVVNDYGPWNVKGRIVDLYRPDFFRICGCDWWSGTTWVTVHVY